jgi:RNA polymerase sigma factor for flagellar operon FliA
MNTTLTKPKPRVSSHKEQPNRFANDNANDDTDQLWALFKAAPNDQLRNRLVERYMPLVRSRAERVWARLPDGIELDDLISVGTFGLMDAIAAYDLSRGVRFEAFCLPRVQGAMLDELRSNDWVPRMVRSKATKLNEAFKALELRLGRKPSDQEVADQLGIPAEEVHQLYAETHSVNITSLDKTWSENDGSKDVREIDILADRRSEDPTERLAKVDMIRSFTKGLTKTERLIVILYYYEELTMREIGATLELSESRVSQMHSAIVERIKRLYKEG